MKTDGSAGNPGRETVFILFVKEHHLLDIQTYQSFFRVIDLLGPFKQMLLVLQRKDEEENWNENTKSEEMIFQRLYFGAGNSPIRTCSQVSKRLNLFKKERGENVRKAPEGFA